MEARRRIPSALRVAAWTAITLVVVLVLYVASVGPAARLLPPKRHLDNVESYGLESNGHWESAYAPVLWVTDRSRLATDVASWYLEACGAGEVALFVRLRNVFHELGSR